MKIYKNFYFWYLLLFSTLALITYLNIEFEFLNESTQKIINLICFYQMFGFLPVGVSQVILSIALYLKKYKPYWLFYFIPLVIWIALLLIIQSKSGYQNNHQLQSTIGIGIPIYCYVCHVILYFFHQKEIKYENDQS